MRNTNCVKRKQNLVFNIAKLCSSYDKNDIHKYEKYEMYYLQVMIGINCYFIVIGKRYDTCISYITDTIPQANISYIYE